MTSCTGLQPLMRKVYCAKVAIILNGKDAAPLLVLSRVSQLYSESFYLILHILSKIKLLKCILSLIATGMYYYEATVTDEGLCRVGWATDLASFDLGKFNDH